MTTKPDWTAIAEADERALQTAREHEREARARFHEACTKRRTAARSAAVSALMASGERDVSQGCGSVITETVVIACEVAGRRNDGVRFTHNDITVTITPGETPEVVYARWSRQSEARRAGTKEPTHAE